MEQQNNSTEKKKNWVKWVIAVVAIIILALLLLRSCGSSSKPGDTEIDAPIGSYSVADSQQSVEEEEVKEDVKSISFAGFGKCTVSADNPNIELQNPEVNFVDMVFTITDQATGEVVARTEKVPAGNFVYVNVMDHFTTPGVYNINITVSTYDSETGEGMNGVEQEVELTVQ